MTSETPSEPLSGSVPPAPEPNGQPHESQGNGHAPAQPPSPTRIPRPGRLGSRTRVAILAGAVLLLGGGGVAAWSLLGGEGKARADVIWQRVQYGPLQLTILERGTLESADNKDIVCQ